MPSPEHTTNDPEDHETPRATWHADLVKRPTLPREPLVEGLIDKRKSALLYGPSNVGKSWAGLYLAAQLARTTGSFFGHPTFGPATTLLILSEDDDSAVKERMRLIDTSLDEDPLAHRIAYDWPELDLAEPEGLRYLDTIVGDTRPDLVVIDNLTSLCGFEFSDRIATWAFSRALKRLRARHSTATMTLTHPKKGGNEPRPRSKTLSSHADAIFGSIAWRSMADSILSIEEDPRGDRTRVGLRHIKQRLVFLPDSDVREFEFNPPAGIFFRPIVGAAARTAPPPTPQQALLRALQKAKTPLHRDALPSILDCTRATIRSHLDTWLQDLKRDGHTVLTEGGNGRDGPRRYRLA